MRERITALGRAHDFVRPHSRDSQPDVRQDSLHGLMGELFAPYQRDGGGVRVTGEDVRVDDRSATPLALVFHELATNASKYGALSTEGGTVTVAVAEEGGTVAIDWIEQGGPPVTTAATAGFGTQLIELSAARQLGGTVAREWRPAGLRARIELPLSALSRG